MIYYSQKLTGLPDTSPVYKVGETFLLISAAKPKEGEPFILVESKRNKVQLFSLVDGRRLNWPIRVADTGCITHIEFQQISGGAYLKRKDFKLSKTVKR